MLEFQQLLQDLPPGQAFPLQPSATWLLIELSCSKKEPGGWAPPGLFSQEKHVFGLSISCEGIQILVEPSFARFGRVGGLRFSVGLSVRL